MACPKCLGLMFVGAKHCGHCGSPMVLTRFDENVPTGGCPRCRIRLEELSIENIPLAECSKCCGCWMTVEAFERLCSEREGRAAILGRRRALAGDISKRPITVKYVPCPVCGQLMNRSNFARVSGVIIETCKGHGVWFDADELPRIVEFIGNGGMSVAREREISEIKEQRDKLKLESREDRLMSRRLGAGDGFENDPPRLIGFLRDLFE